MSRGNDDAENSWIAMIIKTGDCDGTGLIYPALLQRLPSFARYFRKRMRNDSRSFFDGDDRINRHIRQLVDLSAWPCDHERFDLGSLAKAEMDSRITGRHIARPALCLLDLREPFRG